MLGSVARQFWGWSPLWGSTRSLLPSGSWHPHAFGATTESHTALRREDGDSRKTIRCTPTTWCQTWRACLRRDRSHALVKPEGPGSCTFETEHGSPSLSQSVPATQCNSHPATARGGGKLKRQSKVSLVTLQGVASPPPHRLWPGAQWNCRCTGTKGQCLMYRLGKTRRRRHRHLSSTPRWELEAFSILQGVREHVLPKSPAPRTYPYDSPECPSRERCQKRKPPSLKETANETTMTGSRTMPIARAWRRCRTTCACWNRK